MLARRTFLSQTLHIRVYKRYTRCITTLRMDPSIQAITCNLAQRHPSFAVPPNSIAILSKPAEFYTLLLDMIRRAESRIFISSLYIGSAEIELVSTLHDALRTKPSLQLYLHLDLNRSTRPGPSSTAKILLPLIRAFPSRVHVSLFRSPSLRGILAKMVPPRFNEGWGTWHAKIYGVDDEVMISGANLNQSYFTDRQDRYIHFSDQPCLAQYCFDFLRTVSTFSYSLLPTSVLPPTAHSYRQEDYTLHWPDPDTHPHYIHKKAGTALSAFQNSQRALSGREDHSKDAGVQDLDSLNVLLFPIIQAGQFNIREEETVFASLFRHLDSGSIPGSPKQNPRPLIDLTSGYFGLYQPYQDLVLKSDVETRIVAASPKANGFFGSKGISGRIPEGYTLLEQRFMRAVEKAGRLWNPLAKNGAARGVQLSEWEKDGWTYHAKGIWVSPNSSSPPVLTLFGSTNLNSRSAHIDTELSFIMAVPSQRESPGSSDYGSQDRDDTSLDTSSAMSLRHCLAAEIDGLRAHAIDWQGGQRNVRFWTKVIVRIVKGML